jgi:hypothetical protein
MTTTASKVGATLALATALLGASAPAAAQMGTIRFDQWLFYQENFGDTARWQYRPRVFVPWTFGEGWTFTQRVDVPLYYTNASGPDNPSGEWKFGVSDMLVEEIFDTPEVTKNVKLRGSLRLVFPTGGQSPFGADQWQVAPGFGGNWKFPDVGHGLTFAPFARYFYGFNEGAGVTTKRRWDIFPTLTVTLDKSWYLDFWPEQGMSYNIRSGKWFIPFEAMVGNRISKQWEYSFGGSWAVNDADQSYKWLLQGRLRYYFD